MTDEDVTTLLLDLKMEQKNGPPVECSGSPLTTTRPNSEFSRPRALRLRRLELVTEGELHYTRLGEGARVKTDAGRVGEGAVIGQRGGVKAHGISQVVGVGAETQRVAFGKPERLVDAEVDTEEALTAEVVALAGFAREGQTEEAGRIG